MRKKVIAIQVALFASLIVHMSVAEADLFDWFALVLLGISSALNVFEETRHAK